MTCPVPQALCQFPPFLYSINSSFATNLFTRCGPIPTWRFLVAGFCAGSLRSTAGIRGCPNSPGHFSDDKLARRGRE